MPSRSALFLLLAVALIGACDLVAPQANECLESQQALLREKLDLIHARRALEAELSALRFRSVRDSTDIGGFQRSYDADIDVINAEIRQIDALMIRATCLPV